MYHVILLSLAILAGLQSTLAQNETSVDDGRCDFPDDFEVRNCGWPTQEDCEDKNCCWNEDAPFKCYHPKDPCAFESNCFPGSECTNVAPAGDGMFDCECPDWSNREDCRTRQGHCMIEPFYRIACGLVNHNPSDEFDGTPEEACHRRGCCYNNTIVGVIWCFHPAFKMVKWVDM